MKCPEEGDPQRQRGQWLGDWGGTQVQTPAKNAGRGLTGRLPLGRQCRLGACCLPTTLLHAHCPRHPEAGLGMGLR